MPVRAVEEGERGDGPGAALDVICQLIESAAPEYLCSILVYDLAARRFQHASGPSLPPDYRARLDGALVECEHGPCAQAVVTRSPVIVEDFTSDPRWPHLSGLVAPHGLRSSWSLPIVSARGVAQGAFTLYGRRAGPPGSDHLRLVERVMRLASIAIERTRTEAALRESEAMLARAQRLSATGSFSWRPTGETSVSAETRRICELSPAQPVSGELLRDLIHPDDVDLFRGMLASGGTDFGFEARLRLSGGRIKHIQVVASALRDAAGRVTEWTGAVRDVSAEKRAEDALQRVRSELAHVARLSALGALTASIAHEVNQPLAGVVLNGDACLRWLTGPSPNLEEACEAARRVVRDGQRAGAVIERLRSLFRRGQPACEPVDLSEALGEVLALARRELQQAHVVVRTHLPTLPPVRGDRVQLQQVLLNLLVNAAEAMATVPASDRAVLISAAAADGEVTVSVRDSGPGFEPGTCESSFEPFTSTKPAGMGMGLSICRAIVESHGGRIEAALDPEGPGATVRFTIPRA